MPTEPTEILTVREVAEYLKVRPGTIYRMAAAGEMPGFKVGGARGASGKARSTRGRTRIACRRRTRADRR